MKTKILIILSTILIFALNSCDGKPVASFNKTSHDFGNVPASTTVSYTFLLSNKGNSPLVIERIKAG